MSKLRAARASRPSRAWVLILVALAACACGGARPKSAAAQRLGGSLPASEQLPSRDVLMDKLHAPEHGTSSTTPPLNFNSEISEMFLMFAYGAYCPQESLAAWDCAWCGQYGAAGFTPTAFFNAADNFGFAGYHNDTNAIVIAFRGTVMTNLQNWITDLSSIGLMPYPGCSTCQVGVGFYTAYQALMDQVRGAFDELIRMRPDATVVFTGHSLGAALATIAAADLCELNPGLRPVLQLYGSPRIGNIDMADHVQGFVPRADAMRMVWIDDIVPHLPPVSAGFNHINTEVWMPSVGGTFQVCNAPPYGEDPDCSDSVPMSKWSVEDHLSYYGLSEGC